MIATIVSQRTTEPHSHSAVTLSIAAKLKSAFSGSRVKGSRTCFAVCNPTKACSVPSCRATALGSSDLQRTLTICTGIAKCLSQCGSPGASSSAASPISRESPVSRSLSRLSTKTRNYERVLCASFATVTLYVAAALARCDGRDDLRHSVPRYRGNGNPTSPRRQLARSQAILRSWPRMKWR